MTYPEAIEYMYSALPMFHREGKKALKPGLDNILLLCRSIGNPQNKIKTVHIAGTNGKGSTAHCIAAVLQAAGYKTGLFTSPHLKNFTERVRVNGVPVSEQAVCQYLEENRNLLDRVKASFFEMNTALAFWHFAEQEVDIAIIETGLGGRLDSTNIITPLLSVITNIAYDHTDLLGETLPEIASEKAGIIKPEIPVVISEVQPETIAVFLKKAAECQSELFMAEGIWRIQDSGLENGYRICNVYKRSELILPNLNCQLKGNYQLKNLPGILQAINILNQQGFKTSDESIRYGLSHVTQLTGLKGRWQTLALNPLVICDTAHNEAGIKEVTEQIYQIKARNKHIVIGMVNDKDPNKVLSLLPTDALYYFCAPNLPRGLNAEELQKMAVPYGLKGMAWSSVAKAVSEAIARAAKDDFVFIGGSNFVVAEIENL